MGIFEQIFTYLFLELVSEGQIWGNLVLVTIIEKQSLSTAFALGALFGAVDGQPAKQRKPKPGPLWNFCFRRVVGVGRQTKIFTREPPGGGWRMPAGCLSPLGTLQIDFKKLTQKEDGAMSASMALLLSIRSRGNTSRAPLSTSSASICTSPKLRV